MSTNYYAITNYCDCCGRRDREHIGKNAAGEVFFSAGDDGKKTSWAAWKEYLGNPKLVEFVEDEYGNSIELSEFVAMVESMPHRGEQYKYNANGGLPTGLAWLDGEGYSFCDWEFS